ncbi:MULTISPECIES: DUF2267 domain-containing protein [Streptomycetaceae]|uniref:Putative pterin-4-alpha-carbinolamine dehydratase n=1 Tax=Streptantibioticus cattleyicolor (strain ATCC 35852 / DSM 46488 / JCM 4925 / NBRC 14057 / NRRL 8057) TaxID=1003195 RepID=F8JSY7_STREN|nr:MULTISPECIES: DUF2267 domain-containing protein [Streptomycetaceae]AEW98002.1 hypothetical protein SCATT_56310 [Streptantibioticus cattleyicolor NRRL 8057 = DSM 46488]MYS62402.1 DUF2267 domain-containing protein [Streptomyces sp. SID5468]CCB78320.1 conserved protein of unknown function [Streptantibioticus cattleyicolor NRRL 8057 = DSM 46488]
MITHERLVQEVSSRARLAGSDDAGRVVKVTLASLTHQLAPELRRRLRQAVPAAERDATVATGPPAGGGATGLLGEVSRYLGTPPERARYLTQAVLSTVCDADPEVGRELRDGLPEEFGELFTAPEPYPERMHAATDAPAPLTPAELERELRRRPRWNGDVHRLTRTVALPADRLPPLLGGVRRAAEELGHRAEHRVTGDGVTFVLHTRSVGGVTPLDLRLADRIDEAVAAVSSGGRPGR